MKKSVLTILIVWLMFLNVLGQGAQTSSSTTHNFPPNNFISICQACCSNSPSNYKVSVNYDNNTGSPTNGMTPNSNYYLVWQDNFSTLDTVCGKQADGTIWRKKNSANLWYFPKWLVDIAPKGVAGGSNNQHKTTKDNISIVNNELVIKLTQTGTDYISGALYHNSQDQFGYYEARIKIPNAAQTFPTFWLFGGACNGNNGMYQEIDICDFAQNSSSKYGILSQQSVSPYACACATKNQGVIFPTKTQSAWLGAVNNYQLDMSADYFIYGLDWRPDSIIYYINNSRIFGTLNNVNVSPLRTILELKVMSSQFPSPPSGGFEYHIDWIRYYKRVQDMNLILNSIPSSICNASNPPVIPYMPINTMVLDRLHNFIPDATLTTAGPYTSTGVQAAGFSSWTSPSLQDLLNVGGDGFNAPSLPTNKLAAYFNLGGGSPVINGAWGNQMVLQINTSVLVGNYTITMNIPGVPTNLCPKKTITVGNVIPPTPTALSASSGMPSSCSCRVIATVPSGTTGITYNWSSSTGGIDNGFTSVNSTFFNYSGCGTETITVSTYKNGCSSSSFTGNVTCYMGGTLAGQCDCDGIIKPGLQPARYTPHDSIIQNNENEVINNHSSIISQLPINLDNERLEEVSEINTFFPNPVTNGELTIVQAKNAIGKVRIFSLQGKKLIEFDIAKQKQILDISELADSIYILQIENEEGISQYKMQVRKE